MNIRKLFIFISIYAALTACVPQELTEEVGGNGAEGSGSSSYTGEGCSLELVIRGGDYGSDAQTKADYDDYIANIETNEFKRLMLMIVDDTGKLVAYRVLKQGGGTESPQVHDYDTNTDLYTPIDFDNPASPYVRNAYPDPLPKTGVNNYIVDNGADPVYDEIHLEFKYEFPLHTETDADLSSERLTPGWYTILAIGNYNHEIFTGSGDDYGGTSKTVKNLLDDIYYEFNKGTKDGIDYFAPKKYNGSAWVQSWPDGKTQFPAGRDLIKFAYQLAPNSKVDPINHGTETDKTDFMRSAEYDIIVSKVERFFLNPGQNNFDMELKRTTARVEFEIENFSERKMKIVGLEFSPTFASGNTWLFPHVELPVLNWTNNDRHKFKENESEPGIWGVGAMDPTGPSAVVKFDPNATYAKGEAHTFFDCLIYETRPDPKWDVPYWYSLGVIPAKTTSADPEFYDEDHPLSETSTIDHITEYSDLQIHNAPPYYLTSQPTTNSTVGSMVFLSSSVSTTIVSKTEIGPTLTPYNNFYILKSMRSDGDQANAIKRYLYDDGFDSVKGYNVVKSKSLDKDITIGIEAIWKESNYKAYLWKWDSSTRSFQNCMSNRYLSIPAGKGQDIKTISSIDGTAKLSISSYGDGGIGVKITSESSEYYLNMNEDTQFVGTWTLNNSYGKDAGCQIGIFQISLKDKNNTNLTKSWGKELIENPLMAIEDGSGDAMPYYLNEINRNEHLKVRIGVSYNENSQSLNFQVKSWTDVTNGFEFE